MSTIVNIRVNRTMLLIALVFFILIILFAVICGFRAYSLDDQVSNYKTDTQELHLVINKKGEEVAQQSAIMSEQQEQLQVFSDSTFKLSDQNKKVVKKYLALVTVKQQFSTSMTIPFKDSTIHNGLIAGDSVHGPVMDCLPVPMPFSYEKGNAQLYGTVTRLSLDIDSLKLTSTISLEAVQVKNGVRVDAKSSDSSIKITGMTSIIAKQRPTAWQRWGKAAVGAIAASLLTYKLTKH